MSRWRAVNHDQVRMIELLPIEEGGPSVFLGTLTIEGEDSAAARAAIVEALARVGDMEAALRRIEDFQRSRLDNYRRLGIVFEDIGKDPTNWQHVAFSTYTDLCEIANIVRDAFDDTRMEAPRREP